MQKHALNAFCLRTLFLLVVLPFVGPLARADEEVAQRSDAILSTPFLQNIGPNGCSVVCETARVEPKLRLKWAGGEVPFTFKRFEQSGTYRAIARIDGLKPGTRVDWNVAGLTGSFTTWKNDGGDFKCAIFGDFQGGPLSHRDWSVDPNLCGERMFRDMVEVEKCDFAVGTGDVADRGDYWTEIRPLILERTGGILGSRVPFFMTSGNHDSLHPQNMFFFENPTNPKYPDVRSFAFVRDNCLFICLDDAEGGIDQKPSKPAMRKWLEDLLQSETAQKAKFRFVFRHVPMFDEEFGNCDRSNIDLFAACGVDCVFSGDHHGYERIERAGVRQVVNGCAGYFNHGHPGDDIGCNWYGSETRVGGHVQSLTNHTWRFEKPGAPGILGPPTPIYRGLFPGYATLEVKGDTATFRMLGFNADGSKIGLIDSFEMKSGVRPPRTRGLSMERYAYDKTDWSLAYILTGRDGAVLELAEKGAQVLQFRKPTKDGTLVDASASVPQQARTGYGEGVWRSEPIVDEKNGIVGVVFTSKVSKRKITYRLLPGNRFDFLLR